MTRADPLDESDGMTSWPIATSDGVDPSTPKKGVVESLDFLLWLLTGHIRRYEPAPPVRNDLPSRAWNCRGPHPSTRASRHGSLEATRRALSSALSHLHAQ